MKFRLLEDLTDDEFLDRSDREIFEYYMTHPEAVLMEMADIRGNDVRIEDRLPFSFYMSTKGAVRGTHAIRVKILWNPSKMGPDADGNLELHSDYEYKHFSHRYKPTAKELSLLKDFFKKYKVLFAAVWEQVVDYEDIRDYFKGYLSFKDLLTKFDLSQYDEDSKELYDFFHCKNLEELEQVVRKYSIFNMND